MKEMKVHPWAELFPLPSDDELLAMATDIAEHGLREPIVVNKAGEIVDGRSRHQAMQRKGITIPDEMIVETELTGGALFDWIVSRNLHRRHLSEAQRAAIAAELIKQREIIKDEAANLQSSLTQAQAAAVMKVSERSVATASKVLKKDKALHQAVKGGKVSAHAAGQILEFPDAERAATIRDLAHGDARAALRRLKGARGTGRARNKSRQPDTGALAMITDDGKPMTGPLANSDGDQPQRGQARRRAAQPGCFAGHTPALGGAR